MVQIILDEAGPLPISKTFQVDDNSPMVLEVAGSVWSATNSVESVGIQIIVDGKLLGSSMIFSNAGDVHRATVPKFVEVKLDIGQHTLELHPLGNTVSDHMDGYTAVLHF